MSLLISNALLSHFTKIMKNFISFIYALRFTHNLLWEECRPLYTSISKALFSECQSLEVGIQGMFISFLLSDHININQITVACLIYFPRFRWLSFNPLHSNPFQVCILSINIQAYQLTILFNFFISMFNTFLNLKFCQLECQI